MSISEYVIKFEQLYFKAKPFHMEILDGVLAYRLLNSANLTNEQKQLVKVKVINPFVLNAPFLYPLKGHNWEGHIGSEWVKMDYQIMKI